MMPGLGVVRSVADASAAVGYTSRLNTSWRQASTRLRRLRGTASGPLRVGRASCSISTERDNAMPTASYSEAVSAASDNTDTCVARLHAYCSRVEDGRVEPAEAFPLTLGLATFALVAALREVAVTIGMRD